MASLKPSCSDLLQEITAGKREAPDVAVTLLRDAVAWDIRTGGEYLESSGQNLLDIVREPGEDRSGKPDTNHDLHSPYDFEDWMDARAKQARVLAHNVNTYVHMTDYAGKPVDKEIQEALLNSFADRAVMALYGIDERAHAKEIAGLYNNRGEKAYYMSRREVMHELRHDGADTVLGHLYSFDADWRDVQAEEAKLAAAGAAPICKINDLARSRTSESMFSQGFLERWVAEVKGHECFHDRACPMHDEDRPGILITGNGVDFDKIRAIVDICDNQAGHVGMSDTGHDQVAPAYVLDAVSVIDLAHATCEQAEKSKAKARQGLDAKAAEIEASSSGFDMNAYREAMADRYAHLSVEDAKKLSDEELSDLALADQEQSELGD